MTVGSEREAKKRGTNRTLPRRERRRNRRTGSYGWRWVIWCGWCKHDHAYASRYSQDVVANTHRDRMEHDCKEKALARGTGG